MLQTALSADLLTLVDAPAAAAAVAAVEQMVVAALPVVACVARRLARRDGRRLLIGLAPDLVANVERVVVAAVPPPVDVRLAVPGLVVHVRARLVVVHVRPQESTPSVVVDDTVRKPVLELDLNVTTALRRAAMERASNLSSFGTGHVHQLRIVLPINAVVRKRYFGVRAVRSSVHAAVREPVRACPHAHDLVR
jgi:hypothetical protein